MRPAKVSGVSLRRKQVWQRLTRSGALHGFQCMLWQRDGAAHDDQDITIRFRSVLGNHLGLGLAVLL